MPVALPNLYVASEVPLNGCLRNLVFVGTLNFGNNLTKVKDSLHDYPTRVSEHMTVTAQIFFKVNNFSNVESTEKHILCSVEFSTSFVVLPCRG